MSWSYWQLVQRIFLLNIASYVFQIESIFPKHFFNWPIVTCRQDSSGLQKDVSDHLLPVGLCKPSTHGQQQMEGQYGSGWKSPWASHWEEKIGACTHWEAGADPSLWSAEGPHSYPLPQDRNSTMFLPFKDASSLTHNTKGKDSYR